MSNIWFISQFVLTIENIEIKHSSRATKIDRFFLKHDCASPVSRPYFLRLESYVTLAKNNGNINMNINAFLLKLSSQQ